MEETTIIEFNDIKKAMRFINDANQELVIRKNEVYDKNGVCIAVIKIQK